MLLATLRNVIIAKFIRCIKLDLSLVDLKKIKDQNESAQRTRI